MWILLRELLMAHLMPHTVRRTLKRTFHCKFCFLEKVTVNESVVFVIIPDCSSVIGKSFLHDRSGAIQQVKAPAISYPKWDFNSGVIWFLIFGLIPFLIDGIVQFEYNSCRFHFPQGIPVSAVENDATLRRVCLVFRSLPDEQVAFSSSSFPVAMRCKQHVDRIASHIWNPAEVLWPVK